MSVPDNITAEEFATRRARAVEGARERGLNGLLVWSRTGTTVDHYGDVLYLSNHHSPRLQVPDFPPLWSGRGHAVMVLPVDDEPVLISDRRDYREDLVSIDDVRTTNSVQDVAAEVVIEKGLYEGTLGLVAQESLLYGTYRRFVDALGDRTVQLEPADEILAALRRVKSAAEVEAMRNASRVGVQWMTKTLEAVEPGRTEADCVAAGLAYAVTQEAFPYEIAVASGEHSDQLWWDSLPSWNNTRKLSQGDIIHFDIWGPVKGYYVDLARSAVVGGKASDAQREVLEGSVGVVNHIIDGLAPGVPVSALFRRGQQWIEDNGFGGSDGAAATDHLRTGAFIPIFGHGIGLGGETPWISSDETLVVEENMVLAVEAMVGRPGVGSGMFEQDVLVTAAGAEPLTTDCRVEWWS